MIILVKTALYEIAPQNLAGAVSDNAVESQNPSFFSSESKMFVPIKSKSSLESELENAAAVPQMRTGSTVHWFGPSRMYTNLIDNCCSYMSVPKKRISSRLKKEGEANFCKFYESAKKLDL